MEMPHHQGIAKLRLAVLVLAAALAAVVLISLLGRHGAGAGASPFQRRVNAMTSCSDLENDRATAWESYQLTGSADAQMRADAYHNRAVQVGC